MTVHPSAMGGTGPIYAVGTIGFDFGTQARRDSIGEEMHLAQIRGNPDDPVQLRRLLRFRPWLVDKVIWVLKVDRIALYALEPERAHRGNWQEFVAGEVSQVLSTLARAIDGQAAPASSDSYVSRVSLAGWLTTRTARLISGQVLPVVEVAARRIDLWLENVIVDSAVSAFLEDPRLAQRTGVDVRDTADSVVRAVLNKTYAELRNGGHTPADRALNFLGTGLVHASRFFKEPLFAGWELDDVPASHELASESLNLYTLGRVVVSRSPVGSLYSDSWDVTLVFFDPRAPQRAKACYVFTVDVRDQLPVLRPHYHRFISSSRFAC
ncbi:hypothetical protein [Mycolicibacterium holsaticum]|uniref:cyanobactin maturation protease PatG family protein n=1 Tax=Mycolicibacterium holsaticum TaxID=152142 RepID=UPI001C7D403F|nr:hypothetical protein [Mycolicibacterium holsaticum]MDA4110028.1 hypothetical protein [Mycolicibacterium holsaticum DSM 44478 = JCM 12374]QZA12056.1 hypothetical protein K3U96_23360 [Mycolicibacterium holsaticum DSM 44478 = JCM 12374]UNC10458.1 hypothetical protein H5U41_03450 [Mycolicibacterium holsaticum DSM 44478 = JCM 12374]